jgi:hypothetical protein
MSQWSELVIHGHETAMRAFLVGFAAARGGTRGVFGDDVALEGT